MRSTARFLRAVIIVLAVVGLLPSIGSAQPPDVEALYVFGDSLADTGNVFIGTRWLGLDPAIPPSEPPHQTYFDRRFSNGYLGFEYLWQRLSGNAPGSAGGMKAFLASPSLDTNRAVSFAFGGTGTPYLDQTPGGFSAPGLKGQVELFRLALNGRKPPKRALFAIVTGANDYRTDPFNVPMLPTEVAANIADSIVALYRMGARDVMVLDLPNLGLIPANIGDPAAATAISNAHNEALSDALDTLDAALPRLRLIRVHLDPLFLDLIARMPGVQSQLPLLEAIAPGSGLSTCLFFDPTTCQDVPTVLFNNLALGFLFWDVVHPTTEAHYHLGEYLYQQLVGE